MKAYEMCLWIWIREQWKSINRHRYNTNSALLWGVWLNEYVFTACGRARLRFRVRESSGRLRMRGAKLTITIVISPIDGFLPSPSLPLHNVSVLRCTWRGGVIDLFPTLKFSPQEGISVTDVAQWDFSGGHPSLLFLHESFMRKSLWSWASTVRISLRCRTTHCGRKLISQTNSMFSLLVLSFLCASSALNTLALECN